MAAYWLVHGGAIDDPAALEEYARVFRPIAARCGAKVIAGRARFEVRQGRDAARVMVVEFPDFDNALACYDDADYQAAMTFAARAYRRDLSIVQGS